MKKRRSVEVHQPPFSTFQMSEILLLLPLAFGEIEKVGPPSLFRQNIGGKKRFSFVFLSFLRCVSGGRGPSLPSSDRGSVFFSLSPFPATPDLSIRRRSNSQTKRERGSSPFLLHLANWPGRITLSEKKKK